MTEIKQQISTESGRSMVEMLGTLAIIGVLSIGGIVGYRFILNKYWINKLEDDAYLRAFSVMTQRLNNKKPTLISFNNKNESPCNSLKSLSS